MAWCEALGIRGSRAAGAPPSYADVATAEAPQALGGATAAGVVDYASVRIQGWQVTDTPVAACGASVKARGGELLGVLPLRTRDVMMVGGRGPHGATEVSRTVPRDRSRAGGVRLDVLYASLPIGLGPCGSKPSPPAAAGELGRARRRSTLLPLAARLVESFGDHGAAAAAAGSVVVRAGVAGAVPAGAHRCRASSSRTPGASW